MRFLSNAAALSALSQTILSDPPELLTDINQIQKHWGQLSPYHDNPEDHFGVDYVGLPEGCQIASHPILSSS